MSVLMAPEIRVAPHRVLHQVYLKEYAQQLAFWLVEAEPLGCVDSREVRMLTQASDSVRENTTEVSQSRSSAVNSHLAPANISSGDDHSNVLTVSCAFRADHSPEFGIFANSTALNSVCGEPKIQVRTAFRNLETREHGSLETQLRRIAFAAPKLPSYKQHTERRHHNAK